MRRREPASISLKSKVALCSQLGRLSVAIAATSLVACATGTEKVVTPSMPSSGTSTTQPAGTGTTVPSVEIAFPYFLAYSEITQAGFDQMKQLSMGRESSSFGFALHEERVFQAETSAGISPEPLVAKRVGDEILICHSPTCEHAEHLSSFDVSEPQLWHFYINGLPISDVLDFWLEDNAPTQCLPSNDANQCTSPNSYIVTIRSIYRMPSGNLQITFDTTRGPTSVEPVADELSWRNGSLRTTSYVESSGNRSLAAEWVNPIPAAGATSLGTATFLNVPTGDFTVVIKLIVNGQLEALTFKIAGN